jgi:hypothetical protein
MRSCAATGTARGLFAIWAAPDRPGGGLDQPPGGLDCVVSVTPFSPCCLVEVVMAAARRNGYGFLPGSRRGPARRSHVRDQCEAARGTDSRRSVNPACSTSSRAEQATRGLARDVSTPGTGRALTANRVMPAWRQRRGLRASRHPPGHRGGQVQYPTVALTTPRRGRSPTRASP